MADIVNLRRHRKRLTREAAEQTAAARRLEFGRSKCQREADAAEQRRSETTLNGHLRIREDET
jgi:hypothetical protein